MKRHPRTFKGFFEWREALGLPAVPHNKTDNVLNVSGINDGCPLRSDCWQLLFMPCYASILLRLVK